MRQDSPFKIHSPLINSLLIASTAFSLSLAACSPPKQTAPNGATPPKPQVTHIPQPPPLARESAKLPPRTLQLNLRLNQAFIEGFGIKQEANALSPCAQSLSNVQTVLTLNSTLSGQQQFNLEEQGITVDNSGFGSVLTFSNTLLELANDQLGVVYNFSDMPVGTARATTTFKDASDQEFGYVDFTVNISDSGGTIVEMDLRSNGENSALAECPRLEALLSGAVLSGVGGDLTVTVPENTSPGDVSQPLVPPSPVPTPFPSPTPVPTPPADTPPTISGISTTAGFPLDTVIITGTEFTPVTSVKFSGVEAYSFTIDSDTQITARVPAISAAGPVSVLNAAGTADSTDIFTPNTFPRTFHITPTGTGDGFSWATASSNLTEAFAGARSGDEIWVAAGTYTPSSSGDRFVSFKMNPNVKVYGGFAGGEASVADRDWETNLTILSGDLNGDDNYTDEDKTDTFDNSLQLVIGADGAILDGFTIRGGFANAAPPKHQGAAIYNDDASPTLRNLILEHHTARQYGGAIANINGSSPIIQDVTISNNYAPFGGGIYNGEGSTPTLYNLTITDNTAKQGAGIFNEGVSPLIEGGLIKNNSSTYMGGGICNRRGAAPTIRQVTFLDNSSSNGGGLYNAENSSPILRDVEFIRNTADNGGGMYNYTGSAPNVLRAHFENNIAIFVGGGMYNYSFSSPHVEKALFWKNEADHGGGMANRSSSSPKLVNNVFHDNSASYGGGLFAHNICQPDIWHNTFYDNKASTEGPEIFGGTLTTVKLTSTIVWNNNTLNAISHPSNQVEINNSVIKGLGELDHFGTSNLNLDPYFVNETDPDGADDIWLTADDGYRLSLTSPAKNFAKPTGGPTDDILGVARVFPNPDIGAYEGEFEREIDVLVIEDLVVGTGPPVQTGDLVTVNYVGTLDDESTFVDQGTGFQFIVGNGEVITGWDQGVLGMLEGGTRKLTIPPHMAYGAEIIPGIPPNSTLVFVIELTKVELP